MDFGQHEFHGEAVRRSFPLPPRYRRLAQPDRVLYPPAKPRRGGVDERRRVVWSAQRDDRAARLAVWAKYVWSVMRP